MRWWWVLVVKWRLNKQRQYEASFVQKCDCNSEEAGRAIEQRGSVQ